MSRSHLRWMAIGCVAVAIPSGVVTMMNMQRPQLKSSRYLVLSEPIEIPPPAPGEARSDEYLAELTRARDGEFYVGKVGLECGLNDFDAVMTNHNGAELWASAEKLETDQINCLLVRASREEIPAAFREGTL